MPPDTGAYFMIAGNTDTFNPMKWNLDVYQFTADWKNTANATFELDTRFELGQYELPGVWGGPGAPQMGNEVNISTVPFYLMYPATYRRFENFESMVCCQTIFSDGLHFLKWFELRNENSEWFINQSGNYAPEDEHFYIPSITLNGNGDIAMGYFVSSQDTYPSVHFTGRRKNDPPGMMTFQELELIKGLYFANTYNSLHQKNRWGDYASMMVDPVDDTTFWFTSMYPIYPTTYGNWSTRIFSLSLTEDIATVVADAGNDTLTCNVGFFQLNSHAENYSSITWNSEGDGSFSNFHSLRATYLRGPEDLANQQVTLTMSATGYQPGSETEDSMVLYLNKIPEVDAGEDMSINYNESVSLNGNVLYAYEYFWATIGDGAFNDTSKLDAIYTPGPADIESREVTLVLTGWEVAPCSGAYRDSLTLFVLPFNISEQSGKHMSMKIYPLPATDIVTVEVNINSGEGAVLQILSQDGNAVFKGDYSPTNRKLVQQFDITYLPIGIYFIRVQAGKEVATRKLLVVR
jgi:hypothetical protein